VVLTPDRLDEFVEVGPSVMHGKKYLHHLIRRDRHQRECDPSDATTRHHASKGSEVMTAVATAIDLLRYSVRRRRWGHQRTRLPGRQRLRELRTSPKIVWRSARPSARLRSTSIQPGERLIGLLMLRDEDDILGDMLRCATQWFDRILVLDGTTDDDRRRRTDAVLDSFAEVVFVARDEDVPGTGPIRDGARQVLLDEARRRYGTDQWIGVLHADEFMDQDPRPMLAARHPLIDPTIRIRLVHAFLHSDDEPAWRNDPERWAATPVRERITHVMWPGVPETRFFFDRGMRDYRIDHHSKTVPTSFRSGPLVDGFSIVQYNERAPEQAIERGRSRADTGWQASHYARFTGEMPAVFVDTLDTAQTPFAPEFRNDPDGPFRPLSITEVPIGPIDVTALAPEHPLHDLDRSVHVLRWWSRARRAGRATNTMLVDHTARLLLSRRLDDDQRRRVTDEFVALTDGGR
jgi:Glycosyl transferase family 2